MRIVVLVKEVPDTWEDRTLDLETGLADRDASEAVLDEIGERALEVALAYADKNAGTDVVVMSMAREGATASVRKALAMGAASAVHIVDDDLLGADLGATAEDMAAALSKAGFDLVITGRKRYQTADRRRLPLIEATEDGRYRLNPLAAWTSEMLEDYRLAHALPAHPLAAEGYPSIGCRHCTDRVAPGEDSRAGRWRGRGKVECGMHPRAAAPEA